MKMYLYCILVITTVSIVSLIYHHLSYITPSYIIYHPFLCPLVYLPMSHITPTPFGCRYFSLQASHPLGFPDSVRFEVENNICQETGPRPDSFTAAKLIVLKTLNCVRHTLFYLTCPSCDPLPSNSSVKP